MLRYVIQNALFIPYLGNSFVTLVIITVAAVIWIGIECLFVKHLMDRCMAEINKYPCCLYERPFPWWLVFSNAVIFGSLSTPVSCSTLHRRKAPRQKWPFPKQTTWGALIKRDYVLRVPLSFPGLVQRGESSTATGPPCFNRAVDGEEGGERDVNEVLGTFSPKSFWYLGKLEVEKHNLKHMSYRLRFSVCVL